MTRFGYDEPENDDDPFSVADEDYNLSVMVGCEAFSNVFVSGDTSRAIAKGSKDVAAGIRSVTRSPVTHLALASVAAVAPPAGTAVAAIGEAGLAVAEGAAAVLDEGAKFVGEIGGALENAWNGVFGGGGPSPEQIAKAKKKRAQGIKKLAEVLKKAQAGDAKSQNIMTALAVTMSPALRASEQVGLAKAMGFKFKGIPELEYVRQWERTKKEIAAEAKKLPPVKVSNPVAPKVAMATQKKILDQAIRRTAEKVRKAAQAAPDGVKGTLVDIGGTNRGQKRWINGERPGLVGFVVRPDGRIIRGVFS